MRKTILSEKLELIFKMSNRIIVQTWAGIRAPAQVLTTSTNTRGWHVMADDQITGGARLCLGCDKPLHASASKKRKYCTSVCKRKSFKYHHEIPTLAISTGSMGALNELKVCVDLISRGVHVFRAVSQACPCDLIAMFDGNLYRVEVKTVYCNIDGKPSYRLDAYPKDQFDVFAAVTLSGIITYEPDVFPGVAHGTTRVPSSRF
jgi:hypothetical protein